MDHLVEEPNLRLAGLLTAPFSNDGIGVEGVFREISEKILPNSTNVDHPRFLAYVFGPPNGIAPYAETIAATINQNCNFWQLSPAATELDWVMSGQSPDARGWCCVPPCA